MTKSMIKSSWLEKMVYGFGNVGANLCWTFMSMYVTMYYTDSVGISAAVAGTVMLVARLFDGISDVLCAMLFESCHMKLGKIRPWFMIAAPLLGISLFLSFHIPAGISEQMKVAWVAISYTFTAAVSYTIYNLAFSAILPLMSLESKDRSQTATIGSFVTVLGVTVMCMATPILLVQWGGSASQGAWSSLSTIYAVLCTILVFLMGALIKEKHPEGEAIAENAQVKEKTHFLSILKIVLKDKYTWLLLALFFLFYLYSGISSMLSYFYKDVMGDLSLYSLGATLGSMPQLLVFAVLPFLFRKMDKNKAVFWGIAAFVVGNGLFFLMPHNLTIVYASAVIKCLGMAPVTAVIYAYIPDLVDHIFEKSKIRVESVVSMSSSIGTKLGTGLGAALVGWSLAWAGYDGAAAVQSAGTQTGIIVMVSIVPLVIGALMMVLLHFWDLGKVEEKE